MSDKPVDLDSVMHRYNMARAHYDRRHLLHQIPALAAECRGLRETVARLRGTDDHPEHERIKADLTRLLGAATVLQSGNPVGALGGPWYQAFKAVDALRSRVPK